MLLVVLPDCSTPISCNTRRTSGGILPGLMPALKMRILGRLLCFAIDSAITLRQALSSSRKRMLFSSLVRRMLTSFHLVGTDSLGLTNRQLNIENFFHQCPLFERALDFSFQFCGCDAFDAQALGRRQRALYFSNVLFALVIECIRDAQNGAELAHDILIAGRELAEAEMLRARVGFAVVASHVGDQIHVL